MTQRAKDMWAGAVITLSVEVIALLVSGFIYIQVEAAATHKRFMQEFEHAKAFAKEAAKPSPKK